MTSCSRWRRPSRRGQRRGCNDSCCELAFSGGVSDELCIDFVLRDCSAVESESKSTRLVTVAVVQAWNPPSLHLAKGECAHLIRRSVVCSCAFAFCLCSRSHPRLCPFVCATAEIEKIRKTGLVKSPIFLLDADVDTNRPQDFGSVSLREVLISSCTAAAHSARVCFRPQHPNHALFAVFPRRHPIDNPAHRLGR